MGWFSKPALRARLPTAVTLPRSMIAAGWAGLLVLPLLLAAKLDAVLVQASADLGASLAERTPLGWRARAEAEADLLEINADEPRPTGDPSSPPAAQLRSAHQQVARHAEPTGASEPGSSGASSVRSVSAAGGAKHRMIPRGIRVRKGRVLVLSRTAATPGASPVAASATRPAGLRLTGVGGLGIAVQDGDVLTHAAGQPLHSLAQVIGLVAGARHQHAAEVSGTLYRGDEPINLIVEMPYLRQRDPEHHAHKQRRLEQR